MMTFAVTQGLPEARQLTNPTAIKILHMAMLYNRSQAAAKVAEGKVKKAVDKSLASDRDCQTYGDPSCPQTNLLYSQVGNAHMAIRYN